MAVVLARIDNRLIHGQVLEAWVPYVKADCIVVANDRIASAALEKTLMAAAVPKGIRVVIDSLQQVAQILAEDDLAGARILLLFESSNDALEARRAGVSYEDLNLGNMHAGEGKCRYSCTISLDPEDIDNLQLIEAQGVRIASQCIPADRERPWRKLVGAVG